MSKLYEVLRELPPSIRGNADEILDAILGSGELISWNRQLKLVVNGRAIPETCIVDLVAHVLYPQDNEIEEPKGFKIFVQALKDIRLESEWVDNEIVKAILDDNDEEEEEDSSESEEEEDGENEQNEEEDG